VRAKNNRVQDRDRAARDDRFPGLTATRRSKEQRMRLPLPNKPGTLAIALLAVGCIKEAPAPPAPGDTPVTQVTGNANSSDAGPTQWVHDSGAPAKADGGMTYGSSGDGGSPVNSGTNTCETYCETVQANCLGIHAQYLSKEQCLHMCADTPLGLESDTSGDTVGCRLYHARVVELMHDPVNHCKHAGPSGGGVCGERCEALCDRAMKLCTTDRQNPQPYTDVDDCLEKCSGGDAGVDFGYPVDEKVELSGAGDTVNCRIYHLRNAYEQPTGPDSTATTHCPHIGQKSATCN
jgi:hypothetical protein